MKVDKDTLEAIKKPVDNVTEVNILASAEDSRLLSERVFSEEFIEDTANSFGITKLGDYIHVQRQVFNTLLNEGFFSDTETRSRTDVNEESGMVIKTNKSSIGETFNKGNYKSLGRFKKIAKLATVRQLPEIIKNGRLIGDNVPNKYKNSTNKTYAYIAYDMAIDGIPVTVKLDIKKSPLKNKLWVHSIITEKNSIGQDVFSENGIGTSYRTDANGDIIPHPDEKVNTLDEKSLLSDRESYAPIFFSHTGKEVLPTVVPPIFIKTRRIIRLKTTDYPPSVMKATAPKPNSPSCVEETILSELLRFLAAWPSELVEANLGRKRWIISERSSRICLKRG